MRRTRVSSHGHKGSMHAAGAAEAGTSGSGDSPQDSAQSKARVPGTAGAAPRKRPLGTAWRDGSHMTIPMTTMFELNPATGQVYILLTSLLCSHSCEPPDDAPTSTFWLPTTSFQTVTTFLADKRC